MSVWCFKHPEIAVGTISRGGEVYPIADGLFTVTNEGDAAVFLQQFEAASPPEMALGEAGESTPDTEAASEPAKAAGAAALPTISVERPNRKRK